MKKSELTKMISATIDDVMKKNKDIITEEVRDAFKTGDDGGHIPLEEAIAHSTSLCLSLAPKLSVAITARLLVNLGLVTLEDDE